MNLNIKSLFNEALSNAVGRPTIYNYQPHAKQVVFHKSTKKIRLYIGGNRAGKTVGGAVESIYHMRGESPFRALRRPPTHGRIVTVSRKEGIDQIIVPMLQRWLPPSDLINGSWEDSYNRSDHLLTLQNGSTAQLMTYEQETAKFAGDSKHWVWFDEEPPNDIYKECRMRVMDTEGYIWLTMTPVDGITWVNDQLYIPGLTGQLKSTLVVTVDTDENPYISQSAKDDVFADLDEADLKARKKGQFVPLGGLVYPFFDSDAHVYKEELDPSRLLSWNQYASMDHGLNNPTCFLFHAVHPRTGFVMTFDEIYIKDRTIKEIAEMVHERCREDGRRYPDMIVGDPAIRNRQASDKLSIQKHYSNHGIGIALGNNDVAIGVERVTSYYRTGSRVVTLKCPKLIWETQRLRWKVYESAKKRFDNNPRPEIHKYNDHAPDADRYFFASNMPDIKGLPEQSLTTQQVNAKVASLLGARKYWAGGQVFDENVKRIPQQTEWSYQDEHMGGYY